MPRGIGENFQTPRIQRGCTEGALGGGRVHRMLNEMQREQITALNLLSKFAIFEQFGPSLAQI